MFDILKSKISQAPCLVLVDMTKESIELKLHMDASQYGLGGLLLACVEGNWGLVAYHSHKFNSAEVNYSTTKCKLLAIINCVC